MKTHRIWTITALCWFFALFNVERVFPPVNIASFVYGLSTAVGVSMLAFPLLRRQNFGVVAAAYGVIWIIGKCLLGYAVNLETLPIALTEVGTLLISQYVCLKVAQNTDEFVMTSRQMLDVLRVTSVPNLRQSETALLEEIRRARRHERPLTFVSLTPGQVTSNILARLVQNLTDSLSREYVVGGISRILQEHTKSHDLSVRVGDQILMLLPETNASQAEAMTRRLQAGIVSELGIAVESQIISFGTHELTLSGVLDRMGMASLDRQAPDADVFELRAHKLDATSRIVNAASAS